MSLSMRIAYEQQITSDEDVRGSRRGSLTSKLSRAVQSTLFPDSQGIRGYTTLLEEFRKSLDFSTVTGEGMLAVLGASGLLLKDQSKAQSDEEIDDFERVFCQTLHALCWAFATVQVVALAPDQDGEQDGGAAPNCAAAPTQERGIPASEVYQILGRLLQQWAYYHATSGKAADPAASAAESDGQANLPPRIDDVEPALEPNSTDFYLLAKVLVAALLRVLGQEWFTTELVFEHGKDIPWLQASAHLLKRVRKFLAEAPYAFTIQPLIGPVAYSRRANTAQEIQDDPVFTVPLVRHRRVNDDLRLFLRDCINPAFFPGVVSAINAQQAVAWRLNRRLLDCALLFKEAASDGKEEKQASWAADLSVEELEELRNWIAKDFRSTRGSARNPGGQGALPGDFLDNPLVLGVLKRASGDGDAAGETRPFYLPWRADYRGRIYAETPWFTPQGGDLQRALLEFDEGQVLDAEGVQALCAHGGNLASRNRILSDLGITGRSVVSIEERQDWVRRNEAWILASAQHPLRQPFWRQAGKKPFQFLAFCLAYADWRRDPQSMCRLPIQIDGTCNGLQHIAAIMGDEALAKAVNVVRRDDGLPGDIYTDMADAARADILATGVEGETGKPELRPAYTLLSQRSEWVDRSLAKAVIMTVPYGAGLEAQAEAVAKELDERTESLVEDRLAISMLTEPADFETGVQALGTVIASHLRICLVTAYPVVGGFSRWLQKAAAALSASRMPIGWVTPLGFPVLQTGYGLARASRGVRIGRGMTVSIGHMKLTNYVSPKKQITAFLPNLIHSLDATHLFMVLNTAAEQGIKNIGSIHDCILCRPNEAPALGVLVRETFASLYCSDQRGRVKAPRFMFQFCNWLELCGRVGALSNPGLVNAGLSDFSTPMQQAIVASGLIDAEHRGVADEVGRLVGVQREFARLMLGIATRRVRSPHKANKKPLVADKPKAAQVRPVVPPSFSPPGGESYALDVSRVLQSTYFFS